MLRRKNNFLSNSRNDTGNNIGDNASHMNNYAAGNESAEGSVNKY